MATSWHAMKVSFESHSCAGCSVGQQGQITPPHALQVHLLIESVLITQSTPAAVVLVQKPVDRCASNHQIEKRHDHSHTRLAWILTLLAV